MGVNQLTCSNALPGPDHSFPLCTVCASAPLVLSSLLRKLADALTTSGPASTDTCSLQPAGSVIPRQGRIATFSMTAHGSKLLEVSQMNSYGAIGETFCAILSIWVDAKIRVAVVSGVWIQVLIPVLPHPQPGHH